MKKIYQHIPSGDYGLIDETQDGYRIYWINQYLSPVWSKYIHGQKSCYFDSVKNECDFAFELDFDYEHVTDITLNASLS